MTFSVDADAFDGAAIALEELDELAGPVLEAAVGEIADDALAAVRARARRHHATGKLEDQIKLATHGDGVRIRAGGSIAPIIVGGSAPHIIEPVRARALSLVGFAGGPVQRFAERVRHPGTRPDPFVAEGLDDAAADADRHLDTAGDRLTGELVDDIQRRA